MADIMEPGTGRIELAETYRPLSLYAGSKESGDLVYLLKVRIKLPAEEAHLAQA